MPTSYPTSPPWFAMFVFAFLTFKQQSVINQLCHELSTSLTPIEMYSRELIQNPTTNFEQKQFVNNYILSSLKQHKYILNSRLDFEKILSNEYELRLDNWDEVVGLLGHEGYMFFTSYGQKGSNRIEQIETRR